MLKADKTLTSKGQNCCSGTFLSTSASLKCYGTCVSVKLVTDNIFFFLIPIGFKKAIILKFSIRK